MAFLRLETGGVLVCESEWVLANSCDIQQDINLFMDGAAHQIKALDGAKLQSIDSAGAWQLNQLYEHLKKSAAGLELINFKHSYLTLAKLVNSKSKNLQQPSPPRIQYGYLDKIGQIAINKAKQGLHFLGFIGHFYLLLQKIVMAPRRWPFKAIMRVLEDSGFYALPIIGLLSFLIGIVLAYQLGLQLKIYGANIFIVNLSGMAILREFAPLITAIIVAGRTASAFTAEIGLMKVNEEIDALYAMGLSPLNRLVIPRVIGMVITLPLLTFWADVFGVLGAMVMAQNLLDIHMADFLSRFDDAIAVSDFWTGIAKAPVFGLIIAFVGCFQGFQVSYSAESIGAQTTNSVVQAVFLVIIADAIFSILFSHAGF